MKISITAVALDYGNVLNPAQDPTHRARMLTLTQLSSDEFDQHYYADRLAYDQGQRSGYEYWARILHHNAVPATPSLIETLIQEDILSWLSIDTRLLQWVERLKRAGVRTAILSNMPSDISTALRAQSTWLTQFDVTIFSCEVGCVKPDVGIYQRLLEELGVAGNQVLFIDDRSDNVRAATDLGIHGIHYHSFSALQDVVRTTFAIPLPESME
jgi:putative hydrolase of the HAD superfamily